MRDDRRVPIDHVGIRVADVECSLGFYDRAFELLGHVDVRRDESWFHEWNDFAIAQADAEHPATRGLHIGFAARSWSQIDEWWEALRADGAPDDGPPGRRPEYGSDYYGAFVRDPDGNSVEAVRHGATRDTGALLDHVWIRVRDLAVSSTFYRAVMHVTAMRAQELTDRVQFTAGTESVSILEGPATENLHIAFGAANLETVAAFHEAGLAAGGRDNGAPGERPEYHPGYFGAYLLDPDGNNVESVYHQR
jgi:catechol 2,3-dioxygenase-like lactoylglutathione lyase family enzyme